MPNYWERDEPGIDDYPGIYTGDDDDDRSGFADPGGRSALRAAGPGNPRDQPCPSCGELDRLTRADVARGYQCDACADRDEGGGY